MSGRLIRPPIELARASPLALGMYQWPRREGSKGFSYRPFRHLQRVDKIILRLLNPEDPLKRAIINMPPRHGKSMLSSVLAPVHAIGDNPDRRVTICGYGAGLPTKFCTQAKQIVSTHGKYLWGIEINPEVRAKDNWEIFGRLGGMRGIGIGGEMSGHGSDLFILDDPYKNYQEAHSPAIRTHVWDEYQATVETRVEPGGAMLVIHTRWCLEDLAGHLLELTEAGVDDWHLLSLKAIADEDEYDEDGKLFRRKGEALCPERYPVDSLRRLERMLGPYKYNALYQQDPTVPEEVFWEDHLFDNIYTDKKIPGDVKYLAVGIDPAHGSDVERGCDAAIVATGCYSSEPVFVECDTRQTGPAATVERLIDLCLGLERQPDVIGVEAGGMQEFLLTASEQKLRERGIKSKLVAVRPYEGLTKKDDRIQSLDGAVRNRRFRIRRDQGGVRLVSQMKHYGMRGVLVDAPDALEIGVHLLEDMISAA